MQPPPPQTGERKRQLAPSQKSLSGPSDQQPYRGDGFDAPLPENDPAGESNWEDYAESRDGYGDDNNDAFQDSYAGEDHHGPARIQFLFWRRWGRIWFFLGGDAHAYHQQHSSSTRGGVGISGTLHRSIQAVQPSIVDQQQIFIFLQQTTQSVTALFWLGSPQPAQYNPHNIIALTSRPWLPYQWADSCRTLVEYGKRIHLFGCF